MIKRQICRHNQAPAAPSSKRSLSQFPNESPYRLQILLLFLAAIFLAGCAQKDATWTRIAREGTMRVGLDPTFPPFEVTAAAGVEGIDVDLARALARELGLEVEFVHFGYDGLYDALATGQVDVLASALVIVPGRTRDFAYSEPYFNAGEILVKQASRESLQEMADLDGRRLAVELGAQGHVQATQWQKRLSDLTVLPYPSATDALSAVAAGEADAALVDGVSGRLYLKNGGAPVLVRIAEPVTVEPYVMVVRIDDETLLAKLNEALLSLAQSGELDKVLARWLGS